MRRWAGLNQRGLGRSAGAFAGWVLGRAEPAGLGGHRGTLFAGWVRQVSEILRQGSPADRQHGALLFGPKGPPGTRWSAGSAASCWARAAQTATAPRGPLASPLRLMPVTETTQATMTNSVTWVTDASAEWSSVAFGAWSVALAAAAGWKIRQLTDVKPSIIKDASPVIPWLGFSVSVLHIMRSGYLAEGRIKYSYSVGKTASSLMMLAIGRSGHFPRR